jgi:hypothetical protein
MAKGRSLHIGLNRVDPAGYDGWDGQLTACEADAKDMAAIADKQHFESKMLLTAEATSQAILAEIDAAAADLADGDIFFLTYSGHGGQVPDTNGDETDHYDETWVAYDRQIVDDELYQKFATFSPGVRIAMLSDSCHSGTVAKAMGELGKPHPKVKDPELIKALPAHVQWPAYLAQKETYDKIQDSTKTFKEADVRATVLLISGCQDDQTSADGDRNGLFTGTLLGVWKDGEFTGDYPDLAQATADRMPLEQQPNFLQVGRKNDEFEHEHPFTIEAGHPAMA